MLHRSGKSRVCLPCSLLAAGQRLKENKVLAHLLPHPQEKGPMLVYHSCQLEAGIQITSCHVFGGAHGKTCAQKGV